MARKPRVHVPGGIYHVMLRGNGGQDIFFAAEEWEEIYRLLLRWASPDTIRCKGPGMKAPGRDELPCSVLSVLPPTGNGNGTLWEL
jgi:hypothetical protein